MEKIPVRQIKEPHSTKSFNIIKLESLLSDNDMVQKAHRHNFFFALFLKDGSGEHLIDFTSYPVHKNTVYFIRPGQVHQLTLKKGSTGYLIQFNRDFYSTKEGPEHLLLRKISYRNYCHLDGGKFQKPYSLLANIYEEYSKNREWYLEAIKANLKVLFIEILRHGTFPKEVSNASLYEQDRLEELLELLQRNITSHKQVADYAQLMHLSPFQLNKITKETLGKTCSKIITEQILLEAKRSLLGTNNQITEIAHSLGYDDTSYFIRFFKKHIGFTPEGYREKFK
ncbi:AraC family transcriptional regulator [Echinicola rosea]|uniref:AraC family transcriptional regulator n=1 Tax=Echinicola rosea TaxID=1807691 RepID=A0ABQ1V9U0_9BACT|nr:AraC family transcriptional regulator [Echinicola rosea]GGF47337.1 AraC family transcriptional regulator [Echinicola rosea]